MRNAPRRLGTLTLRNAGSLVIGLGTCDVAREPQNAIDRDTFRADVIILLQQAEKDMHLRQIHWISILPRFHGWHASEARALSAIIREVKRFGAVFISMDEAGFAPADFNGVHLKPSGMRKNVEFMQEKKLFMNCFY